MPAKDLSYNITGYGLLRTFTYPYANKLYEFLGNYGYDVKFHTTKQLGAIQYLLKGAHHTRYEYIFLQWTLINQLKREVKGLGLNSQIPVDDLKISSFEAKPTGADLLQCLAVLANMGHFPDTFSASKVWLHLLDKNRNRLLTGFKEGLESRERKLLDKIISDFDIYNIHLINALFLLGRHKRVDGGSEIVDFSKKLLIEYMSEDEERLRHYWQIYKSIRKIAYLLMDSNYAPIPFKLDLSSIIINLGHYQEAIINGNSTFQKALDQMNVVLENSLYLEPNSLLITKVKGNQIFNDFQINYSNEEMNKVSSVKSLLGPSKKDPLNISSVFQKQSAWDSPRIDWDKCNLLNLTYTGAINHRAIFPTNLWEFEQSINKKLGENSCIVSAMYSPSRSNFRIVYAIKRELNETKKIMKSMEVVTSAITFDEEIKKNGFNKNNQSEDEFKSSLLGYLLKYSFGIKKEFIFDYKYSTKISEMPLFIGNGSVRMSKDIQKYIDEIKTELNPDQLHELRMTMEKVNQLNYKGLILAYLGSTKIREQKRSDFICEFDGLIYLPRKKNNFLFVIEAKNQANGNTKAKTQLTKRLIENLSKELKFEIADLGGRAAYASISFKKDS